MGGAPPVRGVRRVALERGPETARSTAAPGDGPRVSFFYVYVTSSTVSEGRAVNERENLPLLVPALLRRHVLVALRVIAAGQRS